MTPAAATVTSFAVANTRAPIESATSKSYSVFKGWLSIKRLGEALRRQDRTDVRWPADHLL